MKITTKFLIIIIVFSFNLLSKYQAIAENKVIFASKPFSTNPTPQVEFKANTPIYGRIILDKPLKEYCKSASKHLSNVPPHYSRMIGLRPENETDEDGNAKYDELLVMTYEIYVTISDLDKSYIDFDVMPNTNEATTEFSSGLAFARSFADKEIGIGKKNHFGIRLYSEFNESNSEMAVLNATGDLYIDYSNSTQSTQEQWMSQCDKAQSTAKANALKNSAGNAAIEAKTLPLPLCFTKASNAGYKGAEYSTAKIIALLKQKYGVLEISKLTFDKPDGVEDFRSLANASTNEPTCKIGNHVFYFAFKDKDGSYRFSGGVLKMDYVGYGKYGEVYVQNYSPIQNEDPKFPIDQIRDGQGTYGVFLFDGTKLK